MESKQKEVNKVSVWWPSPGLFQQFRRWCHSLVPWVFRICSSPENKSLMLRNLNDVFKVTVNGDLTDLFSLPYFCPDTLTFKIYMRTSNIQNTHPRTKLTWLSIFSFFFTMVRLLTNSSSKYRAIKMNKGRAFNI